MLIRNKSFYMFADAIAVVVSFILALLGRFASLDAGDFQLGNWYGCILMLFIYCGYFILSAGPAYNEAKPME